MKPPPPRHRRCQTCWNLEPCCTCPPPWTATNTGWPEVADIQPAPVTENEIRRAGREVVAGAEQLLREADHE